MGALRCCQTRQIRRCRKLIDVGEALSMGAVIPSSPGAAALRKHTTMPSTSPRVGSATICSTYKAPRGGGSGGGRRRGEGSAGEVCRGLGGRGVGSNDPETGASCTALRGGGDGCCCSLCCARARWARVWTPPCGAAASSRVGELPKAAAVNARRRRAPPPAGDAGAARC
jgi:hypothetical protein